MGYAHTGAKTAVIKNQDTLMMLPLKIEKLEARHISVAISEVRDQ